MKPKAISILLSLALFMPPFSPLLTAASAAEADAWFMSRDGVAFLQEFEGFSGEAYQYGEQWYIGYGTECGEEEYPEGVTQEEAEELLLGTLGEMGETLNAWLERNDVPLLQEQFDALLSFTYNLGTGWMTTDCKLTELLTDPAASYTAAEMVQAFGVWCHENGSIRPSLVQRRIAEACLFLYGDYQGIFAKDFVFLTLDAAGGAVENDIAFYQKGTPFGALPAAERAGYQLKGWQTEAGMLLSAADVAWESLAVSALWEEEAPWANPFSDVSETDWFYPYVQDLSQAGVVAGYLDGTFLPHAPVTLGVALTLILRTVGCEDQAATGSHWASGNLELALNLGLLEGSGELDLDEAASRLLIAQIAAKALDLPPSQGESPFSDTADGNVVALYEAGILLGSYDTNGALVYLPDSSISRAEITTILWRMRNVDIHAGQIQYGSYWVDILEDVPVNPYDAQAFYSRDGRLCYASGDVETRTGVDVSVYQGDIDWEAVKNDGIDFAIIRLGFRGYGESGSMNLDGKFIANLEGASAAGLDVGVYFFSQAITVEEAAEEAEFVLSYLDGYELTYPVVFDWEVIGKTSARTYGLDTETLCACANTFCSIVEEAGYDAMIYLTNYAGYIKYDLSQVMEYDFWFAQYSDTPTFYYDFQMWQYSSSGRVDGISGDVDLDIHFIRG